MTETIVKTIQLVCQTEKHNKIWMAHLMSNNDVICEWGRNDGSELQGKVFEGAGEEFMDKKAASKLKKGYVEA